MKFHLNIASKFALILMLFGTVLMGSLGALAYTNGKAGLQQAVTSELLSMAFEKQSALERWLTEARIDIAAKAASPFVMEQTAILLSAAPGSPEALATHDNLIADFQPGIAPDTAFTDLMIIDAETAQVLVSTIPGEEGKFKENQSYFINGKRKPYVSEVYYSLSLGHPVIAAAAPVIAGDGHVLGVVAGRLNMNILNSLISQRTGLRHSDDSYLVNASGLLVTQPRFLSDPGILQRTIQTTAVKRCLEGNSGVALYNDYHQQPVIGAYRWLPAYRVCLITEFDQAEAFAPSMAFTRIIILAGGLALVIAVAFAIILSRNFTLPIYALQDAVKRLGQGDLDYRVTVKSDDEIGRLTASFNGMAENLKTALGQVNYNQRLLFSLNQSAQLVQRARTPEEIFQFVGHEIGKLGYRCMVFSVVGENSQQLCISYTNFTSDLADKTEQLLGFRLANYRFALEPNSELARVLAGEVVFSSQVAVTIAAGLPNKLKPRAEKISSLLGIEEGIFAPMRAGADNKPIGILAVQGTNLLETDIPAVATFAIQTAIALENARLIAAVQNELAERIQTEEKLRYSEERFRLMVEGVREYAIYMLDTTGHVVSWNPGAERIKGYSADEIIGKHFSIFFLADDVKLGKPEQELAIARQKGHYHTEDWRVRKGGSKFMAEVTISALYDETGELRGFSKITRDITDRTLLERTQQALYSISQSAVVTENLQEFYSTIHHALNTIMTAENFYIAIYDPDTDLISFPYFMDQKDSLSPPKKPGRGLTEYVLRTGLPLLADQKTFARLVQQDEVELVGVDSVDWLGVPLITGSNVFGVMVVQSYTEEVRFGSAEKETLEFVSIQVASAIERRVAQQRVVDALGFNNTLINSSSIGISVYDESGQCIMANKAIASIVGASIEQVLDQNYHHIESWKRSGLIDSALEAVASFHETRREIHTISSFGKEIWLDCRFTPFISNNRSNLILMLDDISISKQAEADLRAYAAKLEQSNRDLQEFAYVASHDLQEPLRKVQAFSDRLAQKFGNALDETGYDYLKRMRDASQRMQILINDLLGFSRVSTHAQPFKEVDLNTVGQEVLSDLENQIERTKGRVEIVELPTLEADPIQMHQVLQNLIGNSLKFHRNDISPIIKVSAKIEGNKCLISVKDNGVGFDIQYLDRIFKPFQRLHNREEYEGSGMGLAICRRIVERHGGSITAKSTPGKGTTFLVTLPVHQSKGDI